MELAQLRRFAPLYFTASYMGADRILRRHLGVGDDFPLPLGLSHGVDFGQMRVAMDVDGPEPIYWAYNRSLLAAARGIKPAVAIPHPFLLAAHGAEAGGGEGTLVIGPPPSPAHDRDLLGRLSGRRDLTILVKPKQNFGASAAFWREQGFAVVTIADEGPASYDSIVRTFSRYERVVGCTFSSALFFGAALGKPVELVHGHRYRVWEVAHIERIFDFDSQAGRDVGKIFAGPDDEAKTAVSRAILGSELDFDPAAIRAGIVEAAARVREPVHFRQAYPRALRTLLYELALRLERPGIATRRIGETLAILRKREVILQELDEVSLWTEGPKPGNPSLTFMPFAPGRIPGDAVDGYPA